MALEYAYLKKYELSYSVLEQQSEMYNTPIAYVPSLDNILSLKTQLFMVIRAKQKHKLKTQGLFTFKKPRLI